jgi:hypothetical protein
MKRCRHPFGFSLLGVLLAAMLAVLPGCQDKKAATGRPLNRPMVSVPEEGPVSADQAVGADPCAARLHDIEGAMLLYYAIHKTLPEKLVDLAPLADFDAPLVFTCPASGQPYGYNRDGLRAPGKTKNILVYDPTPAHNGKRWCIFTTPAGRGTSRSLEVLAVTDPFFRGYQPVAK